MKFKSLQKKKRAGFTLVEMVIVVTILGILSGIGFMKFGKVQETSRKNADYVAAANLATATSLYISEHPKEVEISDKDNEKIKILKEVLTSDKCRELIEKKYEGIVVLVF